MSKEIHVNTFALVCYKQNLRLVQPIVMVYFIFRHGAAIASMDCFFPSIIVLLCYSVCNFQSNFESLETSPTLSMGVIGESLNRPCWDSITVQTVQM